MISYEKMSRIEERLEDLEEQVAVLTHENAEMERVNERLTQFGECAWQEIAMLGRPNVMLYDWLSEQAGELGLK